ncbi:signal transduction histidine kinase [Streptomyces sp. 846.5]|nr:histidine kinase [Streptomyces sp. 846.5]TDU03213.1 signal transduction histidine kinase [Streptomyces sp. 846.5]
MPLAPVLPADPQVPSDGGVAGLRRAPASLVLALVEALVGGVLLLVTYWALASAGYAGLLRSWQLLLLGGLALLLLLARHRFPQAAMMALAALLGVMPSLSMLCAAVSYSTARRVGSPRRRDLVLLASAVLPVLASLLRLVLWQGGRWQYAVELGAVLAAVGVVIPGLVGSAAGQQDRLVRALRERTAAAERAKQLVESESRTEERSRIAAEMHDLVGHRLSLIALHAGGLEMALAKQAPDLVGEAAQVRLAGRDAMDELRQALGVLGPLGRDTGTDALTDATGTRADLLALVEESRAAGVRVAFSWEGDDLTTSQPRVRRAVNRVVREGLTNVHRYASGAAVTVTIRHEPGRVWAEVRNGAPPHPPAATTGLGTGRGLAGLRERVALLGGELTVGPQPGGGFLVRAVLPTDPDADPGRGGEGEGTVPAWEPPLSPEAVERPSTDEVVRSRLAGAVAAVLGLAGLGAVLLVGLSLLQQARPFSGEPPQSVVHLGMTPSQLQQVVGPDSPAVRSAAYDREPARPSGATECIFPDTSSTNGNNLLIITRYCFNDGKLTNISNFATPLAP